MYTGICLPEIIIANLMGLILSLLMLLDSRWKLNDSNIETKCVKIMLYTAVICCIVDPIVFLNDGKGGILSCAIVYLGNLCLFLSNMVLGPAWLIMVSYHITNDLHPNRKLMIKILCALGLLLLILNFFIPIVFTVDANGIYSRASMFWFYNVLQLIFICDGITMYHRARKQSGILKFFPVAQFIFPGLLGLIIQSIYYGVSTIWPFTAVSIACMVTSLQRENIYLDKLTGLYNKYYFDVIASEMKRKKTAEVAAFMMDLNGFKSINDIYGHQEGDLALQTAAMILKNTIGLSGSVIRYAGDEFLIILNTSDLSQAESLKDRLKDNFENYNIHSEKPYHLSIAIGYCIADFQNQTLDDILRNIDLKMYKDKQKFYQIHPEYDRRKKSDTR